MPATRPPLIAIIGNPNTGKTTLFNALTGLRQRTGNYPGVTVAKKSGFAHLPGAAPRVELLDLPGLYSLAASSPDEHVVIDALAGRLPGLPRPDAILCVADSTNLLRNLFLASQAAEVGLPIAIALNHADIVRKRGMELDAARLSERLGGIPVVAVSAWKREGLEAVRAALATLLAEKPRMRRVEWKPCVAEALDILRNGLHREDAAAAPTDAELQRLLFDSAPTAAPAKDIAAIKARAIARASGEQEAPATAAANANTAVNAANSTANAAVNTAVNATDAHSTAVSAANGEQDAPATSAPAPTSAPAAAVLRAARERVLRGGLNPFAAEAVLHYERIQRALDGAVFENTATREFSRRMDTVLLHRILGPIVFLLAMAAVFACVFWVAAVPQGWLEAFFEWLGGAAGALLEGTPVLQSLVVDGVLAGVGAFVGFLPQIATLFFFVALLEDSGYMARAAFLMDKLFSWCGLNGRAFMPMLSGHACAVPAVLATRIIEDPKARAVTAFVVPFMSCSARLPVYTLMAAAFVVPAAGAGYGVLAVAAMYFLGLAVALATAFVLTRLILRSRPQPFVLELPRYQVPAARDVFVRVWDSAREFITRAGTVIFSITILIWALLYFPHSEDVAAHARADFIAARAAETSATPAAVEAALEAATRDAFTAAKAKETGRPAAEIEAALAAVEAAAEAADEDAPKDPLAAALEAHLEPAVALENAISSAHVEHSYLGRFGKLAQPLFAPAGFDWRVTVGVLASFPAREAIIATLGTTYSLGTGVDEESDDLRTIMQKARWTDGPRVGTLVFTLPVALGIMAFFALCSQCGATLAVIRKESGTRWAVASFAYMTALAWLAAVACFQIGTRLLALA
jgi:ferrous iron transport protein B